MERKKSVKRNGGKALKQGTKKQVGFLGKFANIYRKDKVGRREFGYFLFVAVGLLFLLYCGVSLWTRSIIADAQRVILEEPALSSEIFELTKKSLVRVISFLEFCFLLLFLMLPIRGRLRDLKLPTALGTVSKCVFVGFFVMSLLSRFSSRFTIFMVYIQGMFPVFLLWLLFLIIIFVAVRGKR